MRWSGGQNASAKIDDTNSWSKSLMNEGSIGDNVTVVLWGVDYLTQENALSKGGCVNFIV